MYGVYKHKEHNSYILFLCKQKVMSCKTRFWLQEKKQRLTLKYITLHDQEFLKIVQN